METLRKTERKAYKNHYCDGNNQIEGFLDYNDPQYKLAIEQYQKCKRIDKGQKYIDMFIKDGREVWSFKSCLGCNDIIEKYNFYEDL